jgi:hypothetical protein
MNELLTVIRRLVLGLVALAAGLFIFLFALIVGVAVLLYALLRGRRPGWQGVQFRRFGDMGSRKEQPAGDVVDIEAREVREPEQPHQRLADSSSRISP